MSASFSFSSACLLLFCHLPPQTQKMEIISLPEDCMITHVCFEMLCQLYSLHKLDVFTAQFSFFTSDFPGKLPGISECPDKVFFWRVLFWVGPVLPSFLARRIMDERDLSRLFIKCLIPCFFSSAALISSSKESHPFASFFAFSLRTALKKETLLIYTIVCHIIHCHHLTDNNGFTLAFYFQTICFHLVNVSPLSKKEPKSDHKSEISCNTFTKLQQHKQFHFNCFKCF